METECKGCDEIYYISCAEVQQYLNMSRASSKWAWFTSNLYTVDSILVEALDEPPCLLKNCL